MENQSVPSTSDFEQRFRQLVDASPMGIHFYALDAGGQLIFKAANPAADHILGVDHRHFVGLPITAAFPSLATTEIPTIYRRLAEQGGTWQAEQVDYQDEHVRGAFQVHAFQISPGNMAAMFLDITERKRAEQELSQTKALLQAAIEASPAGVLIADAPDVRIRLVNSAALAVRGDTPAVLRGIPVDQHVRNWQMLHPDGTPYDPQELPLSRATRLGETVHNEEAVIVRDSGEWRRVLVNAGPVRHGDGDDRIDAGVAVFLDITESRQAEAERRRLERQMQHTQKLESLGILAGGIAHDFNNLLCVMLGGADLALLDLAPEHPACESLTMIRDTAQRATELCRQLLAYSGKGRFVVEPLDLSRLVDGMRHLLEVSISKRCSLNCRLGGNLPTVEADATQLRQVILNLVVNASEAIGDGNGSISIATGVVDCDRSYLQSTYCDDHLPAGTYVFVEVADTGCGMAGEAKSRLFDPFYTTKSTGRGLGLAATLGIVRGHHGTIKVYSELGSGSSFKILLPASIQAVRSPAMGEARSAWHGDGTVLLVDDEPAVQMVGKAMLERLGFQVLQADDGLQALQIYRHHADAIRLVILDMTMPRLNGEETFRELRRLNPKIKVILISGYNEQEATSHFAGKGLAGFLQKPFLFDDLEKAIASVLASGARDA